MEFGTPQFWLAGLEIIVINILLSGDNAVVIALACRNLRRSQRRWGVFWGAIGAIVLRIILTFFAVSLLELSWLKVSAASCSFGSASSSSPRTRVTASTSEGERPAARRGAHRDRRRRRDEHRQRARRGRCRARQPAASHIRPRPQRFRSSSAVHSSSCG
jgi:hypothetical protein